MELTKYEQETIINYNQSTDPIDIYTFDKKLQKKLIQYATDYPEEVSLNKEEEDGSMSFTIPKSYIHINRPKKLNLSPEERERRAKQLRDAKLG